MPNELTGDFDVVAEFAIPAINRLLAAMHRIDRFPHSLSLRVDDDPPRGPRGDRFTVVEAVDAFGDPPADHTKVGLPIPAVSSASLGSASALFDPVVNLDVVSADVGPLVPSRLRGVAQLQVAPPRLELPPGAGDKLTVRLPLRSRYFPDAGTTPIAEFVHGELRLTAPVAQVASQTANVVDIDIKASSLDIGFTPTWSSQPLTNENLAGIVQLIRNALRTSFLPSSITLPPGVQRMRFKGVPAGPGAVAVLLGTSAGAADPASVTNVFLGGGDDFAVAAGVDFIRAQFQPIIDGILAAPLAPVAFDVDFVLTTSHVVYTVTLTGASVDVQGGRIVLTINGHAHTGTGWLPDFSFRVRQPFTLSPAGATADLVVGDLSIDITTGGVKGWLVGLFKNAFRPQIVQQRDLALERAGVRETVRRTLSADETFGPVLRSLLTPTARRWMVLGRMVFGPGYHLAYTAVEIRPSGIVLHGALSVGAWSPPHVEFEQVPANVSTAVGGAGGHGLVPHGPNYSALKTWIPGGTIQRFEWSELGHAQPFDVDEHRFVLTPVGPQLSAGVGSVGPIAGYAPLCLTVRGVRLSPSGPVVEQPVSGTVCGFSDFPIVSGVAPAALPMMALTRPDARGMVEVTGHARATAGNGQPSPNLLVHFADDRAGETVAQLVQALREAGRADAATAIVVVAPAQRLAGLPYTAGVVYAADEGAWERLLALKEARRPSTLIVDPRGKVAWRHDGAVERGALTAALRASLAATGPIRRGLLRSTLRLGQQPPNFLFEYAPGRQLTLRKLLGRPVTIVFCMSTLPLSIAAARELAPSTAQAAAAQATRAAAAPVVLAVNDGEPADVALRCAREHGLTATIVPDPKRAIAKAYDVRVWPTVVTLDSAGVVRAVQQGRG